ncbi:MAG: S1 RNA-binding domain-containing protein [Mollicutes bacterium]|jgi:general stress protein 13|nr:S1 RNA-binding domain-containing protein [Mollicutes bacterium]NLM96469.1 S1 RNA-binding domain-containing protein [Halanaerobiaceae bacterium]
MTKYKKGKIVKGTVTGIESYGAFVSLDEYYSGLIHISEISHDFVKDIHDYVQIGDIIYVEILDVDEQLCQLKLSIKNIDYKRNTNIRRKYIKEIGSGFKLLASRLPFWVDENLKKQKNKLNSIDK